MRKGIDTPPPGSWGAFLLAFAIILVIVLRPIVWNRGAYERAIGRKAFVPRRKSCNLLEGETGCALAWNPNPRSSVWRRRQMRPAVRKTVKEVLRVIGRAARPRLPPRPGPRPGRGYR